MKEKIKNFKLSKSPIMLMIIFSIITVVLSLGTSYAANVYLYDSKDVSYDNTRSGITATDVQGAVDELFDAANDYSSMNTRVSGVEETIGDDTLTTTDQTLTGGINEVNGKIVKVGQFEVSITHNNYANGVYFERYYFSNSDLAPYNNILAILATVTSPAVGIDHFHIVNVVNNQGLLMESSLAGTSVIKVTVLYTD